MATESMSSSGTFWARVVRTSKEEACFVDDMERMGLVLFYKYLHCISQSLHACPSLVLPRGRKFAERQRSIKRIAYEQTPIQTLRASSNCRLRKTPRVVE